MDGADARGAGHEFRRSSSRGNRDGDLRAVGHAALFVFADGDREVRLETEPGDDVFVPPFVPHREENPGRQEAVVIIARSSQEGVVVNLDSLWPDGQPG